MFKVFHGETCQQARFQRVYKIEVEMGDTVEHGRNDKGSRYIGAQ